MHSALTWRFPSANRYSLKAAIFWSVSARFWPDVSRDGRRLGALGRLSEAFEAPEPLRSWTPPPPEPDKAHKWPARTRKRLLPDEGYSAARFWPTAGRVSTSIGHVAQSLAQIWACCGHKEACACRAHGPLPERIEAELELLRSMRRAEVRSFAARALGQVDPEALRKIAQILDESA